MAQPDEETRREAALRLAEDLAKLNPTYRVVYQGGRYEECALCAGTNLQTPIVDGPVNHQPNCPWARAREVASLG